MTVEGLAYWAQDDGNKSGSGFYLNTQSFTLDENQLLIYVLKHNRHSLSIFLVPFYQRWFIVKLVNNHGHIIPPTGWEFISEFN